MTFGMTHLCQCTRMQAIVDVQHDPPLSMYMHASSMFKAVSTRRAAPAQADTVASLTVTTSSNALVT